MGCRMNGSPQACTAGFALCDLATDLLWRLTDMSLPCCKQEPNSYFVVEMLETYPCLCTFVHAR